MIALVQRVKEASVTVDAEKIGSIEEGMLILLGVHVNDGTDELDWLVRKCANLRIFRDENGALNRSIVDVGGGALVVSQFTLYGDTSRGNRPSFVSAARPEHAEPLYEQFVDALSSAIGRKVETGRFGAMMDVSLVNDGPVTIWIERQPTENSASSDG
ncbi:MAG: D-tyrosyl-tRNA(Tyr) deacylase [Bacteroidetes bacterium]|nr:D-tyrosyl-tRNA(Tyr) deacylase [Bacteroidota bacterium]